MWLSEPFSSFEDKLQLKIKGDCATGCFVLFGSCENGEKKEIYRKDLSGSFDICYEFDPVSLGVYQNTVSFFATVSGDCHVDEWSVSTPFSARATSDHTRSYAKDGQTPVVQADGSELSVSVVPRKVLFMGNSILLGMFNTYGMCATEACHDYAYLVSQAILERSPNCRFAKLHGSGFEHCESREAFEAWFYQDENAATGRPACESFRKDLDLIILQITDNVNTPEKVAAFRENLPELIRQIKCRCPRARLVWVYGWYLKNDILELVQDTCRRWKIDTVDVHDLHVKENESYSGQISITPEGENFVVKDLWITHPGNTGMALIAERIARVLFS